MLPPGSAPDRMAQVSAPCGGGFSVLRTGFATLALCAVMAGGGQVGPAGSHAEPFHDFVPPAIAESDKASTLDRSETTPGAGAMIADRSSLPSEAAPSLAAPSATPAIGPLDAPPEPPPPPPVPGPDSDAGEGSAPGFSGGGAEGDPGALSPPWRPRFWMQTFRDAGSIALSPARWEGRDYALATAVLGGTAGLMYADRDIRGRVVRDCDPRNCRESRWVKWAGDGWVTIPALGVLYGAGASRGDERLRRTSLAAFESFLVANLYSQTIKRVFNRERPAVTDDPSSWNGPTLSAVNLSFPSGHAVAAWSVFSVWALEYDETLWLPVAAYSLAGAVSASRVWDNRHWASDAFFGSALGFFVARSIVRRHPPSAEASSSEPARPQVGDEAGAASIRPFSAHPRAARFAWAPWIQEGAPGLVLIVSLP